ncbi:RNA-binding cell elongation regulator Jag/EloR [Bacillus sp. DJP31]|uniref:RNA-binding cell elongation regulator Jag/EloR n=1 Tax=Bacillus sp. DJP31 TaxID=3409789 RepID=UPI003BB72ED4
MREVTATGQSIQAAVFSALAQLKANRDDVDIEIIDEGKKGFFGLFGARPSLVLVKMKHDPILETEQYLRNISEKMELDIHITHEVKDREVIYQLSGRDIALLIGKRGQTLNSLQYLSQLVYNRHTRRYCTVVLDAEHYRDRRKETLMQLAVKLAEKAVQTRKDIKLEPMPSNERKIIHTALMKNKEIKTSSAGLEPYRHLVISPVRK